FCEESLQKLTEKLSSPPLLLTPDLYRIEVAFVEVGVDPTTGSSTHLIGGNPGYSVSAGALTLPSEIEARSNLSLTFLSLAQPSGEFPDSTFLYATPSIFGGSTSLGYLEKSVLVGVRVAYSLEDSPWGNLYES